MWDHDGVCACGKRTYLFCQCFKCLQEEMRDDERKRAEQEWDEEVYPTPEEDTPDAQASGRPLDVSAAAAHGKSDGKGTYDDGLPREIYENENDTKFDQKCRTLYISDLAIRRASRTKGQSWKPTPSSYCMVTPWQKGDSFKLHTGMRSRITSDEINNPEF